MTSNPRFLVAAQIDRNQATVPTSMRPQPLDHIVPLAMVLNLVRQRQTSGPHYDSQVSHRPRHQRTSTLYIPVSGMMWLQAFNAN